MRDFLLDDADRAFRAQIKAFLQDELAPRAQAIEDRQDWDAVKAAVRALGSAGYLRLMFADLYRGPLERPGLTHATILSEEAEYLNYAFETTKNGRANVRTPVTHAHLVCRHLLEIK